jgi:hypothetical protein
MLAVLLLIGTVFLRGDGCIMKDKVIEIVVTSESSIQFVEDEDNATFADPALVNFDADIDDALAEAGYSRDDIKSAKVVAAHYGVVANDDHDWVITGAITVQRLGIGAPVTAVTYTSQSVDAALGQKIPAPLETAAVDVINAALADYIDGQTGTQLEFVIQNGAATPAPSAIDRMEFTWKAWISIYVILEDNVEWPDPF